MTKLKNEKAINALQCQEPETLSTEELLTVLLGNEEKARKILNQEPKGFHNQLNGITVLLRNNIEGLQYLGLTLNEAAKIKAAIELGKRSEKKELTHISCPQDVADYMMPKLRYKTHEYFYVMLLNTKNRIMKVKQVSEGSLSSSVVHPREVYSHAIINHAAVIVAIHNHPSGDTNPSSEDKNLTTALKDAGEVMGIPLMDHVIIGDNTYYSFKQHGLL